MTECRSPIEGAKNECLHLGHLFIITQLCEKGKEKISGRKKGSVVLAANENRFIFAFVKERSLENIGQTLIIVFGANSINY